MSLVSLGMLPNLLLFVSRAGALRFAEQLTDALLLVAGAIRAGASLPLACARCPGNCSRRWQGVRPDVAGAAAGVTLDDALVSLERRMGGDDFGSSRRPHGIAEKAGQLAETLSGWPTRSAASSPSKARSAH